VLGHDFAPAVVNCDVTRGRTVGKLVPGNIWGCTVGTAQWVPHMVPLLDCRWGNLGKGVGTLDRYVERTGDLALTRWELESAQQNIQCRSTGIDTGHSGTLP